MKLASIVLVSLLVLSAGSTAQIITFIIPINSGQVVPPTGSPGTGTGTASLDLSTSMLSWNISWSGLQGTATAAHFHGPAMPGQNAGVQLGVGTSNPNMGSSMLSPMQVQQVLASLWYLNIHSTMFPGGEIRGQLIRQPQMETAFGLGHVNIGQAVLDPSGGTLVVSNIGSSGLDGVSADLDDIEFLQMQLQLPDSGPLPPTAQLVVGTQGTSMNPIVSLMIEPKDALNTTDLTLGGAPSWASQVEIALLDSCGNEVLSGIFPAATGTPLATVQTEILSMDFMVFGLEAGLSNPRLYCWLLDLMPTVTIPGVGSAMAAMVEIKAVGTAPADDGLGGLALMGMDLSSFTITDEAIGLWGNDHRAAGSAEFEYDALDRLTVSNIGSSGLDGVRAEPGILGCPGETVLLSELRFDTVPMPMPNGAQQTFTFELDAGLQMTETFTDAGPGVVSIDVAHLPASGTHLVQVWGNGSLVMQKQGVTDAIGTANAMPMGVDALMSVVTFPTGPTHGLRNRFDGPTQFNIDGQPAMGDELRILVDGPYSITQGPMWDFDIMAKDLPAFTLEGEVAVASPWEDLGFALDGAAGAPKLMGHGPLMGGELMALELTNAAPSAPCVLFASFVSNPVPFKGGVLCTVPPFLTLSLFTQPDGSLYLAFPWPPIVPSGAVIYHQYGIADAGAPVGVALSNCLKGTTP